MKHKDKAERKLEQLCRQAERRLSMAFAELAGPELEGLQLDMISPAAGGAGMMVVVRLPPDAASDAVFTVGERLESLKGRLRSEVAAAIHRKKTPQLYFTVLPYDC